MRHILLTLTFLLCATISFAQRLAVESFTHDEMNLEARLDGGRTDLNGKQCALLKVMVLDDIVDCEGGNVGNIITKGTVKKVFVSPSARYIKLEFKYHYPLKITFEDYGYKSLTESATYDVSIVDANTIVQPSNQQQANSAAQQTQHQQVTVPQQSPSQQPNANDNIMPVTVNGVTFNMIKVDGGTFTMGATAEQQKPADNEKPRHKVTLSTFFIGETEVTQGLWQAIMGTSIREQRDKEQRFWDNYQLKLRGEGDNYPMYYVSWDDCQTFIEKLNSITGKTFRLPTEAEWEYAARGGNKSRHTQYSGSINIDEVGWYWENCGDRHLSGDFVDWQEMEKNNCKLHPVKGKNANELGIYDMSGNVSEWCQNLYYIYDRKAQINPLSNSPKSGVNHVNRGGNWRYYEYCCRISYRGWTEADYKGHEGIGFRLVLSELPFIKH